MTWIDPFDSPTLARVAPDPQNVRTLVDVELIIASDPKADLAAMLSRVLGLEIERRRVRGAAFSALALLARLLEDARRGEGLTRVFSAVSRSDREFRRIWIQLRVPCPWCGDSEGGHLRVLRRRYASGRVFRFAACSLYHQSGCEYTESSHRYVARKGIAVVRKLDGAPMRERAPADPSTLSHTTFASGQGGTPLGARHVGLGRPRKG